MTQQHIRISNKNNKEIQKIQNQTNKPVNKIINELLEIAINQEKITSDNFIEEAINQELSEAYQKHCSKLSKLLEKLVHENNVTFLLIQTVKPFAIDPKKTKELWNQSEIKIRELDYKIKRGE